MARQPQRPIPLPADVPSALHEFACVRDVTLRHVLMVFGLLCLSNFVEVKGFHSIDYHGKPGYSLDRGAGRGQENTRVSLGNGATVDRA
jgi:hypothetical protein